MLDDARRKRCRHNRSNNVYYIQSFFLVWVHGQKCPAAMALLLVLLNLWWNNYWIPLRVVLDSIQMSAKVIHQSRACIGKLVCWQATLRDNSVYIELVWRCIWKTHRCMFFFQIVLATILLPKHRPCALHFHNYLFQACGIQFWNS
jgi:hypothetical protein